jgi:hypothetical protein
MPAGRGTATDRALRTTIAVHACLAAAVGLEILFEVRWSQELQSPSWIWIVVEPLPAVAALVVAWRWQDALRLVPVAALAAALPLALALAHQAIGIHGDQDPNQVYAREGNDLLHGHFPDSEYPAGAVLVFAFEALVGGGATQTSNRFLMLPFQLVTVLALWSLRTRYSSWLAAVVAVWPLNSYYWENRFDLVPAALMLVGLVLARRGRFGWAGVVLGLGAAVKWTPAAPFGVLLVWLLASRRWSTVGRHAAAFLGTFAAVNLPLAVWDLHGTLDAYSRQGGRGVTNESLWFFPLRLLGQTGADTRMWAPAGAPHAADIVIVLLQAALMLGFAVLAVRARGHERAALVLAALCPTVFLLTNRVFSPQFMLVLVAGWMFAAALVLETRLEQLLVGLLVLAACFANLFVYPYDPPYHVTSWRPFSGAMYVAALLATGLLARRALALALTRTAR